jgi:hypothetical protein
MKKQYESPVLEVLVLEQSDIITASNPIGGGFGVTNGTNAGTEHKFGWVD